MTRLWVDNKIESHKNNYGHLKSNSLPGCKMPTDETGGERLQININTVLRNNNVYMSLWLS